MLIAQATDIIENDGGTIFTVAPMAVSVVLGTLIPLIVGLVTKCTASSTIKALVNMTLSAVAGFLTTAIVADGSAVFSATALTLVGLTWIQSVASYFGIWRTLDINSKLAPSAGIGAPVQACAT